MVKQARPAVVRIESRIESSVGVGSGAIFETQGQTGYVITNHHVVEGVAEVDVTVYDSDTYRGSVLGTDPVSDLAVVRICCGEFRTLAFGDASRLEPGDEVVAIGYALGLSGEATITRGIISAIRYNSRLQSDVIQTDAAINPGNSGGPMLSMSGQIMGINTFGYIGTGIEGLGFAVSVKTVQQQIPSLRTGRPPTPTPRPPPPPPPSSYASVSAGHFHTCGVGTNGSVFCWGFNDDDQATPPSGSFTSVSAGVSHTCGVESNGSVVCWGQDYTVRDTPQSGTFTSVSADISHTCGVKTDSSVVCWGFNGDGQATPPSGSFTSVSVGGSHTCGVSSNGSVVCWGSNHSREGDIIGQATPPSGSFVSVSAGYDHTCGVKSNGSVVCWGSDSSGHATPPAGSFTSVSAGVFSTCGVKTNGSVVCWGLDGYGEATPPAGSFTSVSVGASHACGVKTNGSVVCWGSNHDFNDAFVGQATPP